MAVRAKVRTPKLSVAPMMERTDRHFRFLVRQISRRTLLYTEMVTTPALLKGPTERLLRYDPQEHPIALQLGGDKPEDLTQCALLAEDAGYDEVNLNVGCPSDRVQTGRFGACLMAEPARVADAVSAMQNRVQIPVTVKHRIGIDDLDRYEDMLNFVDVVAKAGCWRFSVHARKAWLQGLSPKENRTVPPLRYDDVYRLKRERPDLDIEINGGIKTLAEAQDHLRHIDAVMIGRAAYDDPYLFAEADNLVFGDDAVASDRQEVGAKMLAYAEAQIGEGQRLHSITRHMMGLFTGVPGARAYRRHLSTHGVRSDATPDVLAQALALVPG
jgi:tRNA-dihydrouridine synthase A